MSLADLKESGNDYECCCTCGFVTIKGKTTVSVLHKAQCATSAE